jgi:hypothetical protein
MVQHNQSLRPASPLPPPTTPLNVSVEYPVPPPTTNAVERQLFPSHDPELKALVKSLLERDERERVERERERVERERERERDRRERERDYPRSDSSLYQKFQLFQQWMNSQQQPLH